MATNVSIDVVIPSFRLNERNLLPILEFQIPEFVSVVFYLVLDNPRADIPVSIQQYIDHSRVFLLKNDMNRGVSYSRNRGMDAGKSDWILFLDDDLDVPSDLLNIYASAAHKYPDEAGFIGLIELPAVKTDFAKAVIVSGAMDIFNIAAIKPSFAWGATANVMLRRAALNGIHFSLLYPKSGGGEDMDFFLRVRETNDYKNYRCLPEAKVCHPWWNSQKPDFKRPYRYGLGNSWLAELNTSYAYRDFLNMPETILVSVLVFFVLLFLRATWTIPVLVFIGGVILIEIAASFIQTKKRTPESSLRILLYVFLLRISYQTGLLIGNLSRMRIQGIGERFHDDGKMNTIFFYRTNTLRIVKWLLYPILVWIIFRKLA